MSWDPRRIRTLRPATVSSPRRGLRSRIVLLALAALIILTSVRPVSPAERQGSGDAGAGPAGAGRAAFERADGAASARSPGFRARIGPPTGKRLPLDNDLGPDWN